MLLLAELLHWSTFGEIKSGSDYMFKKCNEDIYGTSDSDSLAGTEYDIFKVDPGYCERAYYTAKNIPRYGYRRCPVSCCHGDQKTFENIPGNPYEYEYHEGPGVHEWVFWDEWIQHFLDTLALKGGN